MKTNDSDDRGIFTTGTSISDSSAWFLSLVRQIREFRAERRNPAPHVEITAERDPSALDKLVDPPSQLASLYSTIRGVIYDKFHPRHIEMTATPIEVEELWAKKENHIPGLLSLLAHVGVVTTLIVLSVVSTYNKPKVTVDTAVLMEPISVSLPPSAVKSGGGGGGGVKAPTPASKGVLPKSAPVQFVPPTPIPATMIAEVMMEPTVIANIRNTNIISPIGDPNGVLGPPSAGPGTGFGIGNGDGHGVGTGNGPGVGPGSGGGTGGGPYRVGGAGGASAPTCNTKEPNYSDDARKAHIQGDVVLNTVVQKDGSIEVSKVVQSLGYGLDDEAKKVLKQWKCNPGKVDGQPVAVQLQIVIKFHLY